MLTQLIKFDKISTDLGTYWRSSEPYAVLRHQLREWTRGPFFKTANLGGSTEEGFEQAFSSLAFAYLKDKAPRLIDFMVGFQLVDRNEDSTKAMGIFGFRVGNQWLYAPVFFLNGDLKGHELLYIKNQDTFVPMKENWVNDLMAKKPHVLGEPSDQDTFQLGGLMPDMQGMSSIPSFGKHGFDEWSLGMLPLVAAAKNRAARALFRTAEPGTKLAMDAIGAAPQKAALAEVANRLDLNNVLPKHFGLLKTAFEISRAYPLIKKGFDRFYGTDCFSRWARELRSGTLADMTNIMPKTAADRPAMDGSVRGQGRPGGGRRMQTDSCRLIPEEDKPDHPVKSGALTIHVYEEVAIARNVPELDDDDREKLLKDTVLIKDKRDPHGSEASKAYNTQVEQKLLNPHETGLYEVLEKPGDFSRMLVISNPQSNEGQRDFCTVVRIGDSGSKAWLNAHRSNLWADKVELREDFDKWFEDLGDRDSLKKGGTYLAIGASGNGTVPFVVREVYGDGAYKVDFKSHCDYAYERDRDAPTFGRVEESGSGHYVSPYGAKLYVDAEENRGTKLRSIQGELRVPGDFKILTLKNPPKPKKPKDECNLMPCEAEPDSESGSEVKPIHPGKLDDIQMLFTEKTAALKIWDDGSEVQIGSCLGNHRLTKRAALIHLVRDHGLTEQASREMLKQAAAKGGRRFRMVYAPGFGDKQDMVKEALGPGPNAPAMMPPEMGIETMGGRHAVRSIMPQEEHMPVDEMSAGMTDPQVWDNWQNYQAEDFQNVMGQAQQAAASGQKEVFDTSVIGGLLKSVRQDSLVDRYLGDLMTALDKLGRILFLFYWHQEEFEDRYGKADLPELEDSLRNAFEALGDVALFLKEKTVEPIAGEMGDLDLDETARN